MNGRPLLLREADPSRLYRMADSLRGECAGLVAAHALGQGRQLLLDPDLGGVGDPDLAVEHAYDQCDVFALELDAALLDQIDDALDIVLSTGDAAADQSPCSIHAELLKADHRAGVELGGQLLGGKGVRHVEPLRIGPPRVRHLVHHRLVVPAQRPGLLPPDAALIALHLAQAPLGAGLLDDLQLALGRQVVPDQALRFGETPGAAQDLRVALAEALVHRLWDCGKHDGLLSSIIGEAGAQPSQFVGQDRLEVGANLLHPRIGQGAGVEGADAPVIGDDDVHQEVVDVGMRVTGDRAVHQVGLAPCPVLDLQRGPGGMVAEADPPDCPWIGAVLAAGSLACPSEHLGDVPHRPVVGPVHGVPDRGTLGRRLGELGRERDRLVRREHQVEAAELARVLRPGLPRVGAASLEQQRHLSIPGHPGRVDADSLSKGCRHVGAPGRPAVAAGVVGGQASAFVELAPSRVHPWRVDRLGRVLGKVAQQQLALGRRGDLAEVHHERACLAAPSCSRTASATACGRASADLICSSWMVLRMPICSRPCMMIVVSSSSNDGPSRLPSFGVSKATRARSSSRV